MTQIISFDDTPLSDSLSTWLHELHAFRADADRIQALAARAGVPIIGYDSQDLPLFRALSPTQRKDCLSQLRVFRQTLENTEALGAPFDNQDRSLWASLSALRLVPPAELFSHLKPDDVIEIYDLQNIQIWRNFAFMKICSYTLEEMHCLSWTERYERPLAKTQECIEKMGALLARQTPEIYRAAIGEHLVTETRSRAGFVLEARHDWAALLKNREGAPAAWLCASTVRIVEAKRGLRAPRAELGRPRL